MKYEMQIYLYYFKLKYLILYYIILIIKIINLSTNNIILL